MSHAHEFVAFVGGTIDMRTRRLTSSDGELARELFRMMAEVFAEPFESPGDDYLDRLLRRDDFWAFAAFLGDDIVGGVTAHTLPMTTRESSEIFIYDVAVREGHRRKGIGRGLILALRRAAVAAGIQTVFVAVDDEDVHALDFYRAQGGASSPVTLFAFSGDERCNPIVHPLSPKKRG